MGEFSVTQVFIFLGIIILMLAPIGYFGVAREKSGQRVRRGRYAAIFLGTVVAMLVLGVIGDQMQLTGLSRALSFAWIPIEFRLLRLTVQRLRDIGWNRNWAYPCLIPYLGLLVHLFFCFIPSGAPEAAEIVEAF